MEDPEHDVEEWELLESFRRTAAHYGAAEVRSLLAMSVRLMGVAGDREQIERTHREVRAQHAIVDAFLHALELGEVPAGGRTSDEDSSSDEGPK